MMNLTRAEAAEFLKEQDNYVILTHARPDGDTVGSSAALCLGLRSLGKTAHVLRNPGITPRYAWLHEGLTVEEAGENDIIISTDVASPGMLPQEFQHLLDRVVLRIDHHGSATSFTEQELVDPNSASCAEVIWDVLACLGVSPEPRLMDAIYVGLSTDTGCFRFANTTAHTFRVAAICAQYGAKVFELNQQLFETNTLGKLRMQAWMVEHMQMLGGDTMAICAIPKAVEERLGVSSDDMDNISNFPRSVAGVNIAATLREAENGVVKLSVRAVPGYDATRIAVRFGGGGHKGAAGGTLHMAMEEAVKAVEEVMTELCQ
ncbi:MAG: DHH family phosphoesterase [Oscillospiraceae bacterium]|nr:DHH family phosphoesterase [Oscillospiraceae bacterium]